MLSAKYNIATYHRIQINSDKKVINVRYWTKKWKEKSLETQ